MQLKTIRLLKVAALMALEDGVLIWRERSEGRSYEAAWNKQYAGKPVSLILVKGYPFVRVDNHLYAAHRVVWTVAHGKVPALEIDHIDGNRQNFHPDNLREVTRLVNSRNKGMHRNNKSGVNGVRKEHGRWHAYIRVNNTKIGLGRFDTLTEAAAARKTADVKYGFSARHGDAQ